MRTILVTASDTGVGKTHAVAALARLLAADGSRVQIVKVVESGRSSASTEEGDAAKAQRLSGVAVSSVTLATFAAPLAPADAAAAEGKEISLEMLVTRTQALEACDWRILEGAGGIATPIDRQGRDWADFALAIGADLLVVVVPDRLGAINQARLAHARAASTKIPAGIWLNAVTAVDADVAVSNRRALQRAGVPVWAELGFDASEPAQPEHVRAMLKDLAAHLPDRALAKAGDASKPQGPSLIERWRSSLTGRTQQGLRRTVRVTTRDKAVLNLADNDYLALAQDPEVVRAVAAAAAKYGTSASASPLITGWSEAHQQLVESLGAWHGFSCGLLWNSGYAANSAVLGVLPTRDDLVLADRLIHHSMIAGLLHSGARFKRYEHLDLGHLEELLAQSRSSGRNVFVATETVFSMDGDYPDLARLAALKRTYGFCWIVDEAHALGWYGPAGAGLVRAAGVEQDVDVLVGTLGKTLAAGGAYTLFRDETVRDYLVNEAGEFIYSTALPPTNAAAAAAALERVRALAPQQAQWQTYSRNFRARLQKEGWSAPDGDSPVVPVRLDDAEAALALTGALRAAGIWAGAVRPPTVPAGTSRLRFSLKRTLTEADATRILSVMAQWRNRL